MADRKAPTMIDLETEGQGEAGKPAAKGPAILDGPQGPAATPDQAPPVPGSGAPVPVEAPRKRRPSRLARLFWTLAFALVTLALCFEAWNTVADLLAASTVQGWILASLLALLLLTLLLIAVREAHAFARLRQLDSLRHEAEAALAESDLDGARSLVKRLAKHYAGRQGVDASRLSSRAQEIFEPASLYALAEAELLLPLDKAAEAEIEASIRRVALVTAIVPLGLVDVFATLAANFRMIRRIAEIYGGRCGALGAWRIVRAVLGMLTVTGIAGSQSLASFTIDSILSRVSHSIGEGLVNGSLTARVGMITMDACRPLPFSKDHRPSGLALLQRALTGLFGKAAEKLFRQEKPTNP